MYWVNLVFWIVVLVAVYCNTRSAEPSGYMDVRTGYDHAKGQADDAFKVFQMMSYGLKFLFYAKEGNFNQRHEQLYADLKALKLGFKGRLMRKKAFGILNYALSHPNSEDACYRKLKIWRDLICYTLPSTACITGFVAIESYFYVSDWLNYMGTWNHVLFWLIPVLIFILTSFLYHLVKKKEVLDNNTLLFAFVITAWISIAYNALAYNWKDAKAEYEQEMEETFGEDWEQEVEEARRDAFSHRL